MVAAALMTALLEIPLSHAHVWLALLDAGVR